MALIEYDQRHDMYLETDSFKYKHRDFTFVKELCEMLFSGLCLHLRVSSIFIGGGMGEKMGGGGGDL